VDDAVAVERPGPQRAGVVQVAAQHLGAQVGDRLGGGVRAGQPEDLVACADELGDDGRADPAGSAGDEDAHGRSPLSCWAMRKVRGAGVAAGDAMRSSRIGVAISMRLSRISCK
jgi:hypothetical protein